MTERILTNERKEFLVSLSVAILVSNERSEKMLLVKNRQTGKWGPPAGGLQWLDEKDRLETPFESAERELLEETGVKAKIDHNIRGMINLPVLMKKNSKKMTLLMLKRLKMLDFLTKKNYLSY